MEEARRTAFATRIPHFPTRQTVTRRLAESLTGFGGRNPQAKIRGKSWGVGVVGVSRSRQYPVTISGAQPIKCMPKLRFGRDSAYPRHGHVQAHSNVCAWYILHSKDPNQHHMDNQLDTECSSGRPQTWLSPPA
jgi:hypothetical protein